jgi:hypothetical protein
MEKPNHGLEIIKSHQKAENIDLSTKLGAVTGSSEEPKHHLNRLESPAGVKGHAYGTGKLTHRPL